MNLSISQQKVNDAVVRLSVAGEVDLETCADLSTAIYDVITEKDVAEVLVDLQDVNFLDSSGIKALVFGHRLASERGVACRVVNPQENVRKVLVITGVMRALSDSQ